MSLPEICMAVMACVGILVCVIGFITTGTIAYFTWKYLRGWSKMPLFVWLRRRDAKKRERTNYWSKIKVRKNDPAAR